MADILQFTNALLDSANTVSNVVDDYQTKQANLSTQTKNIQLQNDINGQLTRIRQSANFEDWNTQINDFFTQVKSGMSNKDSPYYCQNNLQAEQFEKILEQNQVNVSEQVGRMVEQRQAEKDIIDVQNKKTMLAEMTAGQDYIDQANELDKLLYETGRITQEQYQQSKDQNYIKAYQNMYLKTFDASLDDALAQNKSFEAFYTDIEKSVPELKATDTYGLERVMDKTSLKEVIKKTCQQNYKARLADIQQNNANNLSQIVQEMRQQNTAEGKVSAARRGQSAMNRMQGLKLSEQDRLQYSAIFELALGGDSLKGSGSGSGAKKNDFDKFEDLVKAEGDTAIQVLIDYPELTGYEAAQIVSDNAVNEWFTADYQENFDKDYAEREKTFETVYKGTTSKESVTDALVKRMIAKYPEVQAITGSDGKFTKLIEDMNKNPNKYGTASASDLSRFMLDTILESNANTTGEEILEKFNKYINDCYVESCKYMEFNKKGELEKTYDATNAKDIASAANLLHSQDRVYTYNGEEYWAGQSKEALEKEGGLVDVMKNAVAGTIGADASGLDFYYQRTKNDMTSVPIITYKGNAYEVNATEDGKSFTVKNLTTGEVMDGVIPNNKAARTEAKQEAKAAEKAASQATATTKKEREQKTQESLTASKTTPKAVEVANVISAEEKEWKWGASTNDDKKTILNQAINKIQKDADKVNKNKMQKSDFKTKYGIDYDEWIKSKEENYRYDLILNSK